ncbi:MAG: four helix bundle protein [Cyanobacteria bacterium P01_H01_bin.58]
MPTYPSRSFEDLLVWQRSHQLVLGIYRYSSSFPTVEIYGLTSHAFL